MSTRSLIGIVEPDGSVRAIYCHFDGYVEYVGKMLNQFYSSECMSRKLLALGDISCLDERVEPRPREAHSFYHPADGVTIAYHRDRGEEFRPASRFESKKEMAKEGFK